MPVPPENIMRRLPDAESPAKERLARYFEACAQTCLEHLGRRPLTLVRSVEGTTFFHKGPLPAVPDAVHQLEITKADGSTGFRLWVDDVEGLLGLLEIGVVELHPWGATVDDIEKPDRMIFDLDPDDAVPWQQLTEAAFALRDDIRRHGLESWPKTTGGKGLHVVAPAVPGMDWKAARGFAKMIAQEMEAGEPERYTATSGAKARSGGKIFVDWLRNGRGQTAIGAMSPRARAGGLVSLPVSWDELNDLRPEVLTLDAVNRRPLPQVQSATADAAQPPAPGSTKPTSRSAQKRRGTSAPQPRTRSARVSS
jgi:bifunctional non-homologous end joining protein LigD